MKPNIYEAEKRCCTVCDAKKVCHVCGEQTLWACSDCRINLGTTVYVCQKAKCRDEHEKKCGERLDERVKYLDGIVACYTRALMKIKAKQGDPAQIARAAICAADNE
jgi:hypothetical protein